MYFLGISSYYHDASVALLNADGPGDALHGYIFFYNSIQYIKLILNITFGLSYKCLKPRYQVVMIS